VNEDANHITPGKIDTPKGFTLVEVLVAAVILSVGFGIVIGAFTLGLGIVKKSREFIIATDLARGEVEYLKNVPFPPTTDPRLSARFNQEGQPADGQLPNYLRTKANVDETGFDVATRVVSRGVDRSPAPNNDVLKEATVTVSKDGRTIVTLKRYFARNGM
jgi:prepilin-type N-terminal cleavage/methylation domain-containing protein